MKYNTKGANMTLSSARIPEVSVSAGEIRQSTNSRPVFIVGCPRSGTSFLHHTILSSGDFALVTTESAAFGYLDVRFAPLTSLKNRKRLFEFFVRGKLFRQTGLERGAIEAKILRDCRNIGDFLRIVMEETCQKQGVRRWAEKTPQHGLFIPQIKEFIPDALIVHIIRDGRDAALSLAHFGDIRPFLWDPRNKLLPFGVFWKWIVQKTRAAGRMIGEDYYELRYEDLVEKPGETLSKLGEFIGHDLDYARIRQTGVGSVIQPRTSFPGLTSAKGFKPLGRWKEQCSPDDLAAFEAIAGDCLEQTGYPLTTEPAQRKRTLSTGAMSALYVSQIEVRNWLRSRTPIRHFLGRRENGARGFAVKD